MDNYNALSKSAILTKLALDGYFIDLLTLNSFIKSWQIEAIYENEFGIEFFDNDAYLTILKNLKDKYDKTKKCILEDPKPVTTEQIPGPVQNNAENKTTEELNIQKPVIQQPAAQEIIQDNIFVQNDTFKAVSLDELTKENAEPVIESVNNTHLKNNDTILPAAMKNLKPGPVSPNSNINVDHNCYQENTEADEELMAILKGEDFSQEEIEKADNLINSAAAQTRTTVEENKSKNDELDLMQLAQSFTQNLTGNNKNEDVAPADLEKIFDNSPAESFEQLQDYVDDIPQEYQSLQEDLPLDIVAAELQPPANPASVQGISSSSNLTAQDVREIIRDEITKRTANMAPVVRTGEDVREIVKEIVKETADVAPQNAFKLDISNRTLDMIAKTIAKKIAVKLNDYYKINSSKQDAKLQLFRERTIELKERNQALADENKKLRMLLLESNQNLNSYKPTIFGLFKFTGKRK